MMTMSATCYHKTAGLRNQKSPFQQVIAFGYYDGPTAGVAQCAACEQAYKYDLLAWDENQDVRVYSFAPLPAQSFQQIVKACSVLGEPRWPVWVPKWEIEQKETEEKVESEVEQALAGAGQVEIILAAEDLVGDILALKRLAPADVSRFQALASAGNQNNLQEWLAFLEL